jgi:hypothetical protein
VYLFLKNYRISDLNANVKRAATWEKVAPLSRQLEAGPWGGAGLRPPLSSVPATRVRRRSGIQRRRRGGNSYIVDRRRKARAGSSEMAEPTRRTHGKASLFLIFTAPIKKACKHSLEHIFESRFINS